MDITTTNSTQSFSYTDLGNMLDYNDTLMSNSLIRFDERAPEFRNYIDLIPVVNTIMLDLFFVPDVAQMSAYPIFFVNITSNDITIFGLDATLVYDLSSQLDSTNVRIVVQYLNKYEFIIIFDIKDAYDVSDITLTLAPNSNKFINSYNIKQILKTSSTIAFKLYQRFIIRSTTIP